MKKFLIYIEDEEFQAKLFTRIISDQIKDSNVKVLTFTKAKEAEEYFNSNNSDQVTLALVDLSMYEISGFDMIKKIKIAMPNLRVAVLTSHEDPAIEKQARSLGIAEYFVKNGDLKELERLRKFVLDASK